MKQIRAHLTVLNNKCLLVQRCPAHEPEEVLERLLRDLVHGLVRVEGDVGGQDHVVHLRQPPQVRVVAETSAGLVVEYVPEIHILTQLYI